MRKGKGFMIYCDLDGVLVDFNGSFKEITGKYPSEISRTELWKVVSKIPSYWLNLNEVTDASVLLDFLERNPYQILTGLPKKDYKRAEIEKRKWVKEHIGDHVEVICCLSKDKALYCRKGDILIDDFMPNIERWEAAGGIGILHKNAADTIQTLSHLLQKTAN